MYGPNGTNIDECGSNRANEYSQRDEVSEDAKQRDEYYKNSQRETTFRSLSGLSDAWVELQRV